jgi:hypothetical protein
MKVARGPSLVVYRADVVGYTRCQTKRSVYFHGQVPLTIYEHALIFFAMTFKEVRI